MLVVQNFTAFNQVLLKFQVYVGQSTNQYADHLVSFSLIQKRLNLTYLKSNKESYLSKANKDSSCGNVNATKCAPFIVILGIINSPGEPYSWRGRRQILGMTSIRVFTYCSMVPCNCKVTEKMDSSQQARGREGTKRKENNNCEDPAH